MAVSYWNTAQLLKPTRTPKARTLFVFVIRSALQIAYTRSCPGALLLGALGLTATNRMA
jgi:hypothetical protein